MQDRIFDFNDSYYLANGVDASKLGGRPSLPSANAVTDKANFPSQRDVRITRTFAGYGSNGSPIFFAVLGGGGGNIFTLDAAGAKAKKIADAFPEYIFPQRGANPVGIPNARQSFVHANNRGYFSKNPLGLWIHVWVNYTDKAFNTKEGQKALNALKKKNGLALDGTPIIRNPNELEDLYERGFVTQLTTNDATRYAVCPEIRDPRDGGIAPDAFANFILRSDGSYLESGLFDAFTSLQKKGNWPKH